MVVRGVQVVVVMVEHIIPQGNTLAAQPLVLLILVAVAVVVVMVLQLA